MTNHVFIVDDNTFPIHLKYMFAGTGSKENTCEFMYDNDEDIHNKTESVLVGMLADISRIRKGDKILFYLQQKSGREGMFFGSFKVKEEPFICDGKYLKDKLKKVLTFRVLIEPDEDGVYKYGATERECLDSLKDIERPYEMCWSLIYRKLKGNRGCTMIIDKEFDYIMKKIRNVENNELLKCQNLTYNEQKNAIEKYNYNYKYNNKGNNKKISIIERLVDKIKKGNAYEIHLQAYLAKNIDSIIGKKEDEPKITWIGNEVSCGVGMQSIDLCFFQETDKKLIITACELKCKKIDQFIEKQIGKYIDWLVDYIAPLYKNSKKVIIIPTIIAPEPEDAELKIFNNIRRNKLCECNNIEVCEIRYISFKICDDKLVFEEVELNEETYI